MGRLCAAVYTCGLVCVRVLVCVRECACALVSIRFYIFVLGCFGVS